MVFLAIGMHSAWRRGKLTVTAKPIWWLAGAAVLLSVAIQGLVFREFHPVGLIGFSFGFWIMFSAVLEPLRRLRQKQTLTAALVGMSIAHFGVGLFAIGAGRRRELQDRKGRRHETGRQLLDRRLRFQIRERRRCARTQLRCRAGRVEVTRGGKPVTVLQPQKRHFWVQQTFNSKAAISVSWARDLFVAMGDPLGANAWSMRIQYKLWCDTSGWARLFMALGGLIAATDRRYRIKVPVAAAGSFSPPDPRAELGRALMWKFLLPFAAFVALVVLFAFGLNPNRDIHALASPLIGKARRSSR